MKKALCQDKIKRLGPQELLSFSLKHNDHGGILGERNLNSGSKRFESIVHESSPKKASCMGKSIEKRLFTVDKSDRKHQQRITTPGIQNMSSKNIENLHKNQTIA